MHEHTAPGSFATFSKFIRRCIALACLGIPGFNLLAQENPLNYLSADLNIQKVNINWTAGEQYDILRGTMNYSHTDLSLPGNGMLPIEITRVFRQQRADHPVRSVLEPRHAFGFMKLALPMVTYGDYDYNDEFYNGRYLCQNENVIRYNPLTFINGHEEQIFHKGEDNEYTSVDGWKITCPSSSEKKYFVFSPEGITYEMRSDFNDHYSGFTVGKVTDPNGNTLTYHYGQVHGRNGRTLITSIEASDGRIVNFGYHSDLWVVTSIQSNSSTDPAILKYEYNLNPTSGSLTVTENDLARTHIDFSYARLARITYPTGGSVSYSYEGFVKTANVSYQLLKSRVQSDGAVYSFQHLDAGSDSIARIITTPAALLRYDFRKATAIRRVGTTQTFASDTGKLVRFRRMSRGSNTDRDTPLLDISYTYTSVRNISKFYTRQDADLAVPETVTVRSDNARSVFKTTYANHDTWGYPLQVVKSAPGGDYDTTEYSTTYAYYHGAFDAWIVGRPRHSLNNGESQFFYYDSKGNLERHTVNGVSTDYRWHPDGELHTVTTAPNKTTTYSQYKRGAPKHIKTAENRIQFRILDDNGLVTHETRFQKPDVRFSMGLLYLLPTHTYSYDTLRRLSHVDPAGKTLAEERIWESNNVLVALDANGSHYVRRKVLDAFGRTLHETTFDKHQLRWSTIEYRYDLAGRLVYTSFPENRNPNTSKMTPSSLRAGTHYTYDALDRVTMVRTFGSSWLTAFMKYEYTHDSFGNQTIRQSDARNSTTTTTYRSYGDFNYKWPTRIHEADGTYTVIRREAATGRVKSFTRADQTTNYRYNARKQLEEIESPGEARRTFTYHSDGLLWTEKQGDQTTEYLYYDDNRPYKEIHTSPSAEDVTRQYTYNIYGDLSELITTSERGTQNNTMTFTYDHADDRVRVQTLSLDGKSYTLEYEYDDLSNLSQIIYPNGRTYNLNPDSFGNPQSIKQQGGDARTIYDSIEYNADNSMRLMRRSGHEVSNEIDSVQRPYKYRIKQYANGRTAALGERIYSYDSANNVYRINDTVNSQVDIFSYDSRNRLTEKNSNSGQSWTFGYLPNDNLDWMRSDTFQTDFKYDANSRLYSAKTNGVDRRFDYDDHGNIKAHEYLTGPNSKGTRLLTHDAANQIIRMSDGTRYSYDARGLRVKKDDNGAIYTIYDPDQKLIYRDDVGTGVTSEYFYVDGKLIARRDEDVSNNGSPTSPSSESPESSGVVVSGRTISWPDDGWYQVQSDNGRNTHCEGGRRCTVPSAGEYKVINHSTDTKTYVSVE